LPEYMLEEYPQLVGLLNAYYDDLDAGDGFGRKLKDLPLTRDIGQTPKENLTFIEDELLLGQNYLEGVLDARTGAELSNNYYRTKGTKYSIERFFRSFFGTDPEVVYGKNLTFEVGATIIGPNSGKYILNDKVYQFWGLLIKTDIPQSEWLDLYKLFAHPGGMYVGSEVQIISTNAGISFDNMPISVPPSELDDIFQGRASLSASGLTSITGIIRSDDTDLRIDLDTYRVEDFIGTPNDSDIYSTVDYAVTHYKTVTDMMVETSATMDEDSDNGTAILMSNVHETMDTEEFEYYEDSA
jgi:hypothetical protein